MPHPLLCIVTGMEHSGTTFLRSCLNQHPSVNSGFECGVLLCDTPRDLPKRRPFCNWYTAAWPHWGLTPEQFACCCDTDSFNDFYVRLKNAAPCTRDGEFLIDKTPAYVFSLDKVLEKTDAKCLVIVRNILPLYVSWKKRMSPRRQALSVFALSLFASQYRLFCRQVLRQMPSERVLVVHHSALCRDRDLVMGSVFRFLGLPNGEKDAFDYSGRPLHEDYDVDADTAQARSSVNVMERMVLSALEPRAFRELGS
jgi:hypothetical protein